MAADYKGDVMFVLVTTDEAEHKRVIDFFGIKEEVMIIMMMITTYEAEDKSVIDIKKRGCTLVLARA